MTSARAQRAVRIASVAVLGLLVSCSSTVPPQTARPERSVAPTAIALPTLTARPSEPTTLPSSSLTLAPELPTPEPPSPEAPTPEPTATEQSATDPPSTSSPGLTKPAGRSPFRRVDGFLRPQESAFSVTPGGPGYVAVGWKGVGCSEGRVWTSKDGRDWVRQSTDMPDSYLEEVVVFKGEVYAFGHEVAECYRVGPGTVWRSPDGLTWTQMAVLTGASGHWMAVAATDDRLVAFSSSGGAWLSSDGEDWRRPVNGPDSYRFAGALGHTVVVAGDVNETVNGLAPDVSLDDGDTWQELAIESEYELEPHFAESNGVLLAATRACCDGAGMGVGVPMTTRDGLTWSVAEVPHLYPADAAVAVPGGFVIISSDGPTALSTDGETWFAGPPMPVSDDEVSVHAATAGATGVLLVTMDFRNAMEYDWHVWFAPIDAFDRSRWTIPVSLAE
jgi:hypothetical protein